MKAVTPERLLKDVGRRLAELRVQRDMTQEELASRLDAQVRYVQAIEAGRQNITLVTLAKLAAAVRAPVADFFEPPTTKAPKPGRPVRQR